MRKTGRSSSRPAENGFTVLEVLVGMAILSLLGIGVWSGVAASLRSASRLRAAVLANARLLQLDDRIRQAAGRIVPPWWAKGPEIQELQGEWRVPLVDGYPEKFLVVAFKDGVLSVDDGDFVSLFPGFTSVSVTPAWEGESGFRGLRLDVAGKGIDPLSISARFGGAELCSQGGSPGAP
jgi:prepilin-type N-terminal cleavage/methylation domain-containing protein